jgi:hypothetical protein
MQDLLCKAWIRGGLAYIVKRSTFHIMLYVQYVYLKIAKHIH